MRRAASTSTQRCNRCGQILEIQEFGFKYPDRSDRVGRCRDCVRQVSRMYYRRDPASYKVRAAASSKVARARNREMLRDILRHAACLDCGISDVAILEFDHRVPNDKLHDVSFMVGRPYTWSSILREIAKCDIVCANCHRRRTARHFGWRKLLGLEQLVLPPLPNPGTPTYEHIKNTRNILRRRHRNRAHVLAYLSHHACETCGETDPTVLDFDHLRDKLRDITDIALRGGWADLVAEIEKCRVLCANCHRRHTAATAGRTR